jgi:hypothetical protein
MHMVPLHIQFHHLFAPFQLSKLTWRGEEYQYFTKSH